MLGKINVLNSVSVCIPNDIKSKLLISEYALYSDSTRNYLVYSRKGDGVYDICRIPHDIDRSISSAIIIWDSHISKLRICTVGLNVQELVSKDGINWFHN